MGLHRTTPPMDVVVRPMRPDDVPVAERLFAHTLVELEGSLATLDSPAPRLRSPQRARLWVQRTLRFVEDDPAGCWVAEENHSMTGFATSFRRESTWFLASYAVASDRQGRGIGKALLEAALTHSRGCLRGMLSASVDPRAARRYKAAGFDLHPQMTLSGPLDLSQAPEISHVRGGTSGDQEWMDSLDRSARGAAHGRDHEFLRETHHLQVLDRSSGRGYVYTDEAGQVAVLAASSRRTATRLLWYTFLSCPTPETTLSHVTAANQWAVDVGMAAGLSLSTRGYLGLRGLKPPTPYLHHGALL
ncbi:GNAT family N-acetyltransferase [Nocardioides houyundeii]|uniref:GNAT family N-acetyltransferase n=1 Tax=Nocardioides houyundeii TaxID=2045452 RepID=UPI001F0814A4|nr:GNAT family N-acetyltransferase [Nocardioides houyundeii]